MNYFFRIISIFKKNKRLSEATHINRDEYLRDVINKVGEIVKNEMLSRGYEILFVFPIGAIEIDPKYLSYWFATKKDSDRDELLNKASEIKGLVHYYLEIDGYPNESIIYTSCTFESQETVERDFNGNWYYAMK